MQSTSHYTLSVGLRGFINGNYSTYWGYFAAAALMAAIPAVALFAWTAALHRQRARARRGEGLAVNQPQPRRPTPRRLGALRPERPEAPGGEATVRVRVPRELGATSVALRHVQNGEPRGVEAEIDTETETETWWRASFPVQNPSVALPLACRDRRRLRVAERLRRLRTICPTPTTSSSLSTRAAPAGISARSSTRSPGPLRVERQRGRPTRLGGPPRLGRAPDRPRPQTPREWFGGDLAGIERHLDHIEALGANVLYLTPIFPAGSTHRYDAASFAEVDPLLGGDDALASLSRAVHDRGMRILGDLTLNHCGNHHPWFLTAQEDPGSPERDFFMFDEKLPIGYEAWWGVGPCPSSTGAQPS